MQRPSWRGGQHKGNARNEGPMPVTCNERHGHIYEKDYTR